MRQDDAWQDAPGYAAGPTPLPGYGPATTRRFSAAPRAVDDDLLLGRYRVMSTNDTGGFGTVLTCWDTRLQRRVAIKRMSLLATGPDGITRAVPSTIDEALAEARTSSMLAHPNIVTMFDFEVDRTSAYLVMEYVDGLTLSEFLARVEGGTLTGDECAYLVQSIGKALQFAHDNGVLHLDIKPSNIIINRAGTIKLCDFGMASLASATGYGGARGGTVGYMPPEQIEGDMVDERSDVFSLAVVVWQALTGASPFAAQSAEESLKKIERGPKPKLSKIDPDLAGMCEEAIMGALEANPAMRLPSVDAFVNEVTFAMGDAEEGAASIRSLVSQDVDPESEEEDWSPSDLPLSYRYPWLPAAIDRSVAAGVTLACTLPLAPHVLAATGLAAQTGVGSSFAANALFALAAAAIAALVPAAGSAVVIVAMACALAMGSAPSPASVMIPLVLVASWLVWWLKVGMREPLSTPAVLLASAVGSPLGAPACCAYAFGPLRAAATSLVAVAIATIYMCASAASFDATEAAALLGTTLAQVGTWIGLVGCVAAALVGSLASRLRETKPFAIFGQVLCCAVALASRALALGVENGGIWLSPSWEQIALALLLCVLLCITTAIRGPQHAEREVEDSYESA
jgi:serine/threonine-protein kinase